MADGSERRADGFVEIEEAECRRLLRAEGIGILGTLVDGEVEQRPVNYAVHRASVVVRTDRGVLFEAAKRGATASLAVMSSDAEARVGWSVIAKGQLEPADAELSGVQLFSWAHDPDGKAERIRLNVESLSGRRLGARAHQT